MDDALAVVPWVGCAVAAAAGCDVVAGGTCGCSAAIALNDTAATATTKLRMGCIIFSSTVVQI
jgi:hypothetical protein